MKIITEEYVRRIRRVLHLRKFRQLEQFRSMIQKFDTTPDANGQTEHISSTELALHLP